MAKKSFYSHKKNTNIENFGNTKTKTIENFGIFNKLSIENFGIFLFISLIIINLLLSLQQIHTEMAERVFRRKIYEQMLDWKKNQHGTTALLIRGARRVGKSTIAEEFARNEYDNYLLIDFSKAPQHIHHLFKDISDLDYIFTQLQLNYHTNLKPQKSVIIFDEIQKQPLARQAIKTLVSDGRYDYIETGSLLSIKKKKENILIPSEETRIDMYPMDYEEFRWALGDNDTIPLLHKIFESKQPLGDDTNRKMMRDFRLYVLVGGMPQAVNDYLDTQNLSIVDQRKRSILELYDEDFYNLDPTGQTSDLFHGIPSQLNSNASRYQVSSVITGGKLDRLTEQIAILKDSMTVNLAYHANDPSAGLASHINKNLFKLYCGDTGLFVTLAFWDDAFTENVIYQKLLNDKLKADVGYVYENIVSQMLIASGHKLYYHTWPTASGKHNYEIDFLLSRQAKVCPIEVKSSLSKIHTSIDEFQKKFSSRILQRFLLHPKDIRKEQDLIYLPLYMTMFL